MEASIKVSILKKILESVKDVLTNESLLVCRANGLIIQGRRYASGSCPIGCVGKVWLAAEDFDEYRCHKDISRNINLINMYNILQCAGDNYLVTITFGNNLRFRLREPYHVYRTTSKVKEMELSLELGKEEEFLDIPHRFYDAHFDISSKDFERVCGRFLEFGDTCNISIRNHKKFNIQMENYNTFSITEENYMLSESPFVKQTFSLKCLHLFSKAKILSDTVFLSISKDMDKPMILEYPIKDKSYVRFYLLPLNNEYFKNTFFIC